MKDLNGKIAVVTGAARGMGRLHAENLGREGCVVVLTDVDGAGRIMRAGPSVRRGGFRGSTK
mgnify:CR=1 FL=1